jgi:hypothetical protein
MSQVEQERIAAAAPVRRVRPEQGAHLIVCHASTEVLGPEVRDHRDPNLGIGFPGRTVELWRACRRSLDAALLRSKKGPTTSARDLLVTRYHEIPLFWKDHKRPRSAGRTLELDHRRHGRHIHVHRSACVKRCG